MKNSDRNNLYELCSELVSKTSHLSKLLIADNLDPVYAIDASKDLVCRNLSKLSTTYKRQKDYRNSPSYVSPVEKVVGLRTEMVYDENLQRKVPRIIESTFQYIPILKTLRNLFADSNFKRAYFEYNSPENHVCTSDKYERFCCGKVYQDCELFRMNANSIQIQLATDDVEVCNPLSSRSGLHKLCALYMVIKNMPPEYKSKQKHIQLVCLVNPDDLKTKTTDFNNIWEQVIDELSELETDGLEIEEGVYLKGTLATVTYDNLGGNTCMGFAQGFNATYYCRNCLLNKDICQKTTDEVSDELRTKQSVLS